MFHEGLVGPTVTLDAVLPNPNLYAGGALANLAGEVTVVGGKAYLSYPEDGAARTESPARTNAAATLLVAADVPAWRSVTVGSPIRFEELDEQIANLAVAAGMSLDERFPFLLQGEFEDLQWHVIDGRRLTGGGESHQDHLKAVIQSKRERGSATLVGFYSQGDQGVRQLVEKTELRAMPDSGNTGIGMLSGGTMVQQRVQFARVRRITVGSLDVDSPRVMLAPPQLEGADWGHDLIIGYGFMRHYVVTFDYPGRRVTFTRPPESRR
jgi:hypothetical protein